MTCILIPKKAQPLSLTRAASITRTEYSHGRRGLNTEFHGNFKPEGKTAAEALAESAIMLQNLSFRVFLRLCIFCHQSSTHKPEL